MISYEHFKTIRLQNTVTVIDNSPYDISNKNIHCYLWENYVCGFTS